MTTSGESKLKEYTIFLRDGRETSVEATSLEEPRNMGVSTATLRHIELKRGDEVVAKFRLNQVIGWQEDEGTEELDIA